jgi:hypothetical protein
MKNFNLYDPTNETHKAILHEEIQRAYKLIFEYNESKIWKNMSKSLRAIALLSFDDDKGSDAADEYTDVDEWMKIPDMITNSIDLSLYDTSNLDDTMFIEWLRDNASKLPKDKWYKPEFGISRTTKELEQYLYDANPYPRMITIQEAIAMLFNLGFIVPIDKLSKKQSTANNIPTEFDNIPDSMLRTKNTDGRGGYWTGD